MSPVPDLVLRRARIPHSAGSWDLVLRDGRIADVVPAGGALPPAPTLDLEGRLVRPGLWDAHTHFDQWTVRRRRVDLAPATSAAHAAAVMRDALAATAATGSGSGFLVGYGFRDALWPDAPSLAALDAVSADRPLVLVSGDLHCGWINSAAARRFGVRAPADGLLREDAWMDLLDVLDRDQRPGPDDHRAAADAAAARGVVGIVDFENADLLRHWPQRVADGVTALRVEAAVWPDRLDEAIARGLRTGDVLDPGGLVTMGRLKIIVDGSLNTRTALCWDPYPGLPADHPHPCGVQSVAPERVEELVARAYAAGIAPAVHAIGDRANTQVIDVFERLGVPGTVEHAQLVSAVDFARFGRLGLTASVQPEHAMDDRDVADTHWAGRTGRAFAFRSLLDSGAVLALGSDAPVAPLDPWVAVGAAVSRSRDGREPWHPDERITREAALAACARGRTGIRAGDAADLVVLDEDPLDVDAGALRTLPVAATLLGGRPTWTNL
ncbi:amidohydrolase family protein [Streptomyces sp. NPDC047002]|uniref:amidohydrolase n=1 Tax=Streptomyces sp. NPDC047002 TaxID=3155475 RepID=UPI0034531F64